MDELMPLEAVTERDIDLLLLEELTVSDAFQDWLISKAPSTIRKASSEVKVWHSVSDPELGESDLVLRVTDPDESKTAFLIENKIDAMPQPHQAARYKARGQQGIQNNEWKSFYTVITAPQKYLESNHEALQYDVRISYESIREWFVNEKDNRKRNAYKVAVIEQAIDQNRRGYSPKMDERITRFFRSYWELAVKRFPEIETEDPGARPASSSWISFRPKILGRNRRIWHKMDYGQVDLELPFPASEVDALTSRYRQLLPGDVAIVKRGKSSGLRIDVPILDRFEDFAEQEEKALAAMKAALRLMTLVNVLKAHNDL